MNPGKRKRTRERVTPLDQVPQGVLLYTRPQMDALLQVSIRLLTSMMRDGSVSYLRVRGKLIRFRASHVLRRLKQTSFVCRYPTGKGDTHE